MTQLRLLGACLLSLVFAAGCAGDITGDSGIKLSCYDTGDSIQCSEGDGDGESSDIDEDGDSDDHVCDDVGCVTTCEETDFGSHCVTECEGGLRCDEKCFASEGEGEAAAEPHCESWCTCPDKEEPGDEPKPGDDQPTEEPKPGDDQPTEEPKPGDDQPTEEPKPGDEPAPSDEPKPGDEPAPSEGG